MKYANNIITLYNEENKRKKKTEYFYEICGKTPEELTATYNEICDTIGLTVYLSSSSTIKDGYRIPDKNSKAIDGYYHAYVRTYQPIYN